MSRYTEAELGSVVGHPAGDAENCLLWENPPTSSVRSVLSIAMLENKEKTQEEGWVFLNTLKSISLSRNSFSNSRVIPNSLLTCLCWCLIDICIKHTQTEIPIYLHKHAHDPYPIHQKSCWPSYRIYLDPITSHYVPLPLGHGHLSPPFLPPSQFPLFPGYLFFNTVARKSL